MALAKVGQKVKITNCSLANVWYKDHIGQEFIVEKVIERKGVGGSKGYYMIEGNDFCGVEEIDCVVVKEETMSEFKAGDKVVATATGSWYEVGDVLTLTKPYKDIGWYTVEKGGGYFVDIAKIEHYKQYDMRVRAQEAWEMAERARTRLARCNNDDMKDQIIETVQAKGYWSIWMTVFENDPDVLQRLINAMPGTSQQCFDLAKRRMDDSLRTPTLF